MPTMTRVAPELPLRDVTQGLEHYDTRLGFKVAMTMPAGDYAIVERDGVALHLFRDEGDDGKGVSMHVFVTDLDALFTELRDRGARIVQPIVEQPWGTRDFRVSDPWGNVLKFTEPQEDEG